MAFSRQQNVMSSHRCVAVLLLATGSLFLFGCDDGHYYLFAKTPPAMELIPLSKPMTA